MLCDARCQNWKVCAACEELRAAIDHTHHHDDACGYGELEDCALNDGWEWPPVSPVRMAEENTTP